MKQIALSALALLTVIGGVLIYASHISKPVAPSGLTPEPTTEEWRKELDRLSIPRD